MIPLIGDTDRYKVSEIAEIQIGKESIIKAVYNEGDYDYHVESFDVAPHLSAYMLGYSKMLMVENFQHIAKIGAKPIYTDTDSIKILFQNEEQHQLYKDRFLPVDVKTYGSMDCEGTYTEMITCGPKKAAYKYEDGSYTWVGNGIRARENTKLDVWQTYRNVLDGDVEQVNDFSIRATKDLQLIHTVDATKKLRFLMTKGKVVGEGDETRIQWWKDAKEFEEYCNSIVPMGMAECWQRYKIKSGEKGRCPHNKNGFKTSQALADELKAWKDSQPIPDDVGMMQIDDALSQTLPNSNIDEITGRSIKADVRRITGIDTFTEPQRKRIRDQSDHGW